MNLGRHNSVHNSNLYKINCIQNGSTESLKKKLEKNQRQQVQITPSRAFAIKGKEKWGSSQREMKSRELFILLVQNGRNISNGEGDGTPLQYSCLENPMDGGAWQAAVHGVEKSQTQLSNFTFTFPFPALEKERATHSSILARRIPGTEEPGGLQSMGLHRVGPD